MQELDEKFAWDYLVITCCSYLNDRHDNRNNLKNLLDTLGGFNKDEKGAIADRDGFYRQYAAHDIFNFATKSAIFEALAGRAEAAETFLDACYRGDFDISQEDFATEFCVDNKDFEREVGNIQGFTVVMSSLTGETFIGSISDSANKYFYNGKYNNNNQSNYAPQQENCLVY